LGQGIFSVSRVEGKQQQRDYLTYPDSMRREEERGGVQDEERDTQEKRDLF
jgi:hypothetical protein